MVIWTLPDDAFADGPRRWDAVRDDDGVAVAAWLIGGLDAAPPPWPPSLSSVAWAFARVGVPAGLDDEPWAAWGKSAATEADARIASARSALPDSVTLVVVPRAGDLLSDIPGMMALSKRLTDARTSRVAVAANPAGLLVPATLTNGAEHFTRGLLVASVVASPAAVLTNIDRGPGGDFVPVPLHRGLIPSEVIGALWRASEWRGPVLLLPGEPDAQRALL